MKTGILTITPNIGYGGIMQAYALQELLKKEGHEVFIFNNKIRTTGFRFLMRIVKRGIQKYVLRKDIAVFVSHEYKIRSQFTQQFLDQYLCFTDACYSSNDLYKLCKSIGIDAIVVGSDQVWRPKYVSNIQDYFLSFALPFKNLKKVAYAASFGVDNWEFTEHETEDCARLIKEFDAVAVREDSAVLLVRDNLKYVAKHLIDPTLLLSKANYMKLVTDSMIELPKISDVFTYILDMTEDKMKLVEQISSTFNSEVTHFNTNAENRYAPLKDRIAPPVESWLKGFKDAKFIVTDSFHGCAFSIIFNKPFYIYGNRQRGLARFSSLLRMLKLEDRLVLDSKSLNSEMIMKDIDWDQVNAILSSESEKSLKFIRDAIKF